jgi:hypothetical protein
MDARSCRVILWGEAELDDAVIKKAVETLFGWSTLDIARAGGLDIRQDDDILESFKGGTPEPVLFLAESWEAPGRAVLYFLSSLRNITDKEQRIIVGLINIDHEKGFMAPARADWQNWHETVSRLNDPFIAIEPVTGVMK